MASTGPMIALDEGLDLRKVVESGSILNINIDYDDTDYDESEKVDMKLPDVLGEPVDSLIELEKNLAPVDPSGLVKKRVIEIGGGLPLNDKCTVSIAYSGFWENEVEPFDVRKFHKPLVVNLEDSRLLPGLETAVRSMLVGEMSVFLLSHEVMYGELGIPPRIKPKSSCVFYIKLIKSIITPSEPEINLSEPNMFQRVYHQVKLLYSSGIILHRSKNFNAACQVFRKGVFMLQKCRLANEEEETMQHALLKKLYINLVICYNTMKLPLKACVACNELNRLNSLWNNPKVLFQNAKSLRMIGEFSEAQKKLRRALKLNPGCEEILAEIDLVERTRDKCDQDKLYAQKVVGNPVDYISEDFKREVNNLIRNFKDDPNLLKLTLPASIKASELEYIKEVCIRENLFCNKIQKKYALDKTDDNYNVEILS